MSTLAVGRRRLAAGVSTHLATGRAAGTSRLAGPVRRGARLMLDALLPLLVGLFLASLVDADPDPRPGPVRILGMLAGLGQGIALYWRRSNPRTVTAITVIGALVVQLVAPVGLFPYAGLIAMWSLATAAPPRVSLLALAGLLGVTAASQISPATLGEDTGFAMAVVVAIWAMAEATRSRRAAIAQASRQAAEREQARLARELHDVIAHSVSVIVVQAAAGDDVFDHDPAAARRTLRSIEAAGREALAELRWLLAAIGPADPVDGRHPQPGLDRLDDLAAPLRAVGLIVTIHRPDEENLAVSAGVQLCAYRIVQEALTNVVRHARAGRVEVRIEVVEELLEVSVTDDGPTGPGPFRPGRGLAGMHERAGMLGGTIEAEPHPNGGFRVQARLPLAPR